MTSHNNIFEIIKTKYNYLKYSDERINQILIKIFDLYADKNIISEQKLLNKSIDLFNKYVFQLLTKGHLDIVINYIDLNINFKNRDNLLSLNQIADFFENLNYTPNYEQLRYIIKKSNKLYDYLSKSIDIAKKNISKMDIDKMSNNDIVCSIVETFYFLNDIIINDNIEQLQNQLSTDNLLKLYLLEIDQYKILTAEEEHNLFLNYKNGDEESKKQIINSNLRLVVWVVRKYITRGYDFLDLIQEGNLALIKAVEHFDVEKGNRFSTYAKEYIYQFVRRSLCDNYQPIRIPAITYETMDKVRKVKEELKMTLKREPTKEEVASKTGISLSKIHKIYKLFTLQPISLNMVINDNRDTELLDLIDDHESSLENSVITKYDYQKLIALLNNSGLNEKELKVIYYRFGLDGEEPRTLSQIGKILNLSRERVRNIQNKVLDKLGKKSEIMSLSVYLDDPDKGLEYLKTKSLKS